MVRGIRSDEKNSPLSGCPKFLCRRVDADGVPTVIRAGYMTEQSVSVECMSDHKAEWYRERYSIFRLLDYFQGAFFVTEKAEFPVL